jgi:lysozyme family protein
MDPFTAAYEFIMGPQFDGHEDDSAPGETFKTRWGVTEMTYADALRRGIVSRPFAYCTQDDCKAIYRALYWTPNGCDKLPPAVAMVVFVDATLMGGRTPKENLQTILGVDVDGAIGPQTASSASKRDPAALVRLLVQSDLDHLRSLPNWPRFKNGWTAREEQLMAAALKLLPKA